MLFPLLLECSLSYCPSPLHPVELRPLVDAILRGQCSGVLLSGHSLHRHRGHGLCRLPWLLACLTLDHIPKLDRCSWSDGESRTQPPAATGSPLHLFPYGERKSTGTASPTGSCMRLWVAGPPRRGRRPVLGRPRQVCWAPLPMVGLGALRQAQTLCWSPTTLVRAQATEAGAMAKGAQGRSSCCSGTWGLQRPGLGPRAHHPLTLLPGGAACESVKEAAPLRGSSARAGQHCLRRAALSLSA